MSVDASQPDATGASLRPRVEATRGIAFIVVVRPPPDETWQHNPNSWEGQDGGHYDTVRFFTSSDDAYLGFEAQRISFPSSARVPTEVELADSYRSRGAPGFTASVVVAQRKARLLSDRGPIDAIEIEGTGKFPNGKVGFWRSRVAVVDRTVLHTTMSASEGILAAWVGLPPAYHALVAERDGIRDPQHAALVTNSYVVGVVEASTVFMLGAVEEAEAVRKAESIASVHR